MQCLQIRPLDSGPGSNGAKRYRVILSDLSNYIQCMLASQITHVIHDNSLQTGAIVQIKSYQANVVKGKK